MASSYRNDIFEQPGSLRSTLQGLETAPSLDSFAKKLSDGNFRRLVLTGMGSSYHCLYPLAYRLMQSGLPALLIETSELVHHAPALIDPKSLIVAVTQSGESAEMVQLFNLTGKEVPVIAVTNTADSTAARQATEVVLTQAGEETSVSCKTYLSALAALAWLGDQLTGQSIEYPQLSTAPELAAQYLEKGQAIIDLLIERLQPARQIYLVGRGASLAAVGTGGLIIKESVQFPAEGMSSASFRHGPFELLSPQVFVLVLRGSGSTQELNERLLADIIAAGGQAESVRQGNTPLPFDLPVCATPALPILEILPVQLMTLALAEIKGIQPGRFERASKVTLVE